MRLRELQAAFTGYVAGSSSADTILPFIRELGPASAHERLAQHAATQRLRAAHRLSRAFPATATLLGPRLASAAADHLARLQAAAPAPGDLFRTWPAFLRTSTPLAERPDLGDLAALELARADVADAADSDTAPLTALAALSRAAMAGACLRFVPALELVRTEFEISLLWETVEAGLTPPPPQPAVAEVLVWRGVAGVFHSTLPPAEARALAAAREGAPLPEVCAAFLEEPSPDEAAGDALAGWFRDGLVAFLTTET